MDDGLSEELQQELKACTTVEELEKVAGDAGVELSDDMLQSVAGGKQFGDDECPEWRACSHYCKVHRVNDCASDCTWVTMPYYSEPLVCGDHA